MTTTLTIYSKSFDSSIPWDPRWEKVSLKNPNGTQYQGQIRWHNNQLQPHGQGIWIYPCGNSYEGAIVDGLSHGQGTYKWKDTGDTYSGEWQQGKRHGQGTLTWGRKGDTYSGEWQQNKMHGQGTLTWGRKGNTYSGEWQQNKRHGQGTLTWGRKGNTYSGEWQQNKRHGQGTLTWGRKGDTYSGEWQQNKRHGQGTVTFSSGIFYHASFINNVPVTDITNLKEAAFTYLLQGRLNFFGHAGYAPGIIADVLSKNKYEFFSTKLKNAIQIHINRKKETTIQSIYDELTKSNEVLLMLRVPRHVVGLNIVNKKNSLQTAVLEIFNSGHGLEHHPHKFFPKKRLKFQTMIRIEIPLEKITPQQIKKWITGYDKNNYYQEIFDLSVTPHSPIIKQNKDSAIYQSSQKTSNCSSEWVKAYLVNKMTRLEYTKFCKTLFGTCRDAIQPSNPDWQTQPREAFEEALIEYQRKIDKREKRIQKIEAQEKRQRYGDLFDYVIKHSR